MRLTSLAFAAAVLSLPVAAHADLLGDSVHVVYHYPTANDTFQDLGDVTVPGGGSIPNIASFVVNANQILVSSQIGENFSVAGFNGFEFTDISTDPGIASVTEDAASTFKGTQITFTSSSVFLNFSGLTANPGDFAIFDLTFAPPAPPPPSAVTPEPSSFALMGTGLFGVAGMMRRRFSRA